MSTKTTKVYGIFGRTTAVINIPSGKKGAFMTVTFDRGIPNPGPNYRPATFSTADPVVQSVMENCNLFGSLYTLWRVSRIEEESEPAKKKAAAAPAKNIEPIDGIETMDECIAFLKAKGAKATQLKDNEAIKKYAEKIGVSFPKLNL